MRLVTNVATGIVTLVELSDEEKAQQLAETVAWEAGANDRALAALRQQRNSLLHDTDWWASSDLSITDAQTAYRQALRDLPANTPDPANIIWPTEPSKED